MARKSVTSNPQLTEDEKTAAIAKLIQNMEPPAKTHLPIEDQAKLYCLLWDILDESKKLFGLAFPPGKVHTMKDRFEARRIERLVGAMFLVLLMSDNAMDKARAMREQFVVA